MPVSKKKNNTGWIRPPDWLPLPLVLSSDQKFVGLIAVFDTDNNFLALSATGNYTVDWGDGSPTENASSGANLEHTYTYSSISSSTLTGRGYRQAIVTITPQAGQSLLSVALGIRHSGAATTQAFNTPWLDVICSCDPASTGGLTTYTSNARAGLLEKAVLLNGASRLSYSNTFNNCFSLQEVPPFTASASTGFTNLFNECRSLRVAPAINVSSGTDLSLMFNECRALTEVPELNLASALNVTNMFRNCTSLKVLPAPLNTSSITNFSGMFTLCSSLQFVPLFNTSSGTDFSNMFNGCYVLRDLPLFNTAAGINVSSMFANCRSLKVIPTFNFSSVTTTTNLFNDSYGISKSLVTNFGVSHSYANCNLSATALNEIYTNLPVVVGQTITISGAPGAAGDNPLIATAKGWTVTG